ncbi:hypothetical protein GQ457_04G025480 [Hibiscus cannabinus]
MEEWGIDFGLENNEEDDVTKEIYHVTALVGQYTAKQLCKVPRRTSEQTGHAWVQEILKGHPIRCYEMFRMEKHIFHMICTELVESGLKVTTSMGIEEMVAMFLNMVGHAQGNRMIQERFQHLGETVSRHLHKVLIACLRLSFKYIKPQDPEFRHCHPKIRKDQRYWPFFKNAIGEIDGTHVPCVVGAGQQARFI